MSTLSTVNVIESVKFFQNNVIQVRSSGMTNSIFSLLATSVFIHFGMPPFDLCVLVASNTTLCYFYIELQVHACWKRFRHFFWGSTIYPYQDSRTLVADSCISGFPTTGWVLLASKISSLFRDQRNISQNLKNIRISATATLLQS